MSLKVPMRVFHYNLKEEDKPFTVLYGDFWITDPRGKDAPYLKEMTFPNKANFDLWFKYTESIQRWWREYQIMRKNGENPHLLRREAHQLFDEIKVFTEVFGHSMVPKDLRCASDTLVIQEVDTSFVSWEPEFGVHDPMKFNWKGWKNRYAFFVGEEHFVRDDKEDDEDDSDDEEENVQDMFMDEEKEVASKVASKVSDSKKNDTVSSKVNVVDLSYIGSDDSYIGSNHDSDSSCEHVEFTWNPKTKKWSWDGY